MVDNAALLERVGNGDKEAEELLVKENMGLVWSIVRRFTGRGHDLEDLAQIGAIGLIKAIKKFDTSYGVQFSTYAVPMIMGEIKRFLRDDGAIKISRGLKELAMKGYATQERLRRQFGRDVHIEEIAKECRVDAEDLVEAFEAVIPMESIDQTLYDDGEKKLSLIDKLPSDSYEEKSVNRVVVQEALSKLQPRERQIILLRYFQGRTQAETAKVIGVSQVQISRLEKATLAKIREWVVD